MNIDPTDENFFIDHKAHVIWSKMTWSRKFIKELREDEVETLMQDADTTVFVCNYRDKLDAVLPSEVEGLWDSQVKGHVADDASDFNLDAFDLGYCFTAELWKAKGGKPILVLYLHH